MKATRKNRFKKEKTARRARLRGRIGFLVRTVGISLALAAVSAAFIFVYDCFVQSAQFRAQGIMVTGNRRLGEAQVRQIAGIDARTNILSLNLTTTRKRLLADPWIAEASVGRKIPSEIIITISEEQPLAVLEMANGQAFTVNVNGRIFKRSTETDDLAIPRIQGLSLGDLPVPGKPDTAAFRAVLTLLNLAREENSCLAYADLSRVHMDRDIGATAYTDNGNRAIKFGFGHYREKRAALRHLTARMKSDGRLARSRVIDLQDVNRIVITLAPADESGSGQEEV